MCKNEERPCGWCCLKCMQHNECSENAVIMCEKYSDIEFKAEECEYYISDIITEVKE